MHDYQMRRFENWSMDDKSSLEAAAEAAAKVNAMLIAKGMLRSTQVHSVSGTNVVTKKGGGPNSLVVAEVDINNLSTACRNTLTRGKIQEEISRSSGASVTTRGRYMAPEERAHNTRDRCLYLNVQAASQESVDAAVEKINEIIKNMCGGHKTDIKPHGGFIGGGGRGRHHNQRNRFPLRNPTGQPPPPLMSLPTPPPIHAQMQPHPQQATHTVTIMQEKLYIGLEHAPPNFDTKNKILGPCGSYLQHIQSETGAYVSLRGKGSAFAQLGGGDCIEPMHVHIEHPALASLQEAKKLAENLIQTVQQSYVSFQQALAALPPSVPTGLMTGLPQQPRFIETQVGHGQPPMAAVASVHEQSMQQFQHQVPEQSMQQFQHQVQQVGPPTMLMPPGSVSNNMPGIAQPIANSNPGQQMVIPHSMSLVSSIPAAVPSIIQQPSAMELAGQQPMLLGPQVSATHPQHLAPVGVPQVVGAPHTVQQAVAPPLAAYSHVQPSMHLVSQSASMAPPGIVQQAAPPILAQTHQPGILQMPPPQAVASMSAPTSVVYTVAASNASLYYATPKESDVAKRRFTEDKDDKIPENLLGYQHGPPHLVNLVRSSPPPQAVPPPQSQGLPPPQSITPHLMQGPPPGLILSHLPPEQGQFAHLGGQTILQPPPQSIIAAPPPHDGQQILANPAVPQFQPSIPPPQGPPAPIQGPPPPQGLAVQHQGPMPPHQPQPLQHLFGPPPGRAQSPFNQQNLSARSENRSPNRGLLSVSSATLMPPPPPPNGVNTFSSIDVKREEENRSIPPPKSPDVPWDNIAKRKGSSPSEEPEKKKIRGILKNKQQGELSQDGDKEEEPETNGDPEQDDDTAHHPASPQYQGQPLRYPTIPSDPNLPPTSQESGIPHPHRPLHPAVNLAPLAAMHANLPPGHHIVQHLDPNLPPQVHLAPPHLHLEGHRPDGPPPAQIVVEHPGPHGASIHIAHPRLTAPGQIHVEHPVGGGPARQVIMEHPPPQGISIDQCQATLQQATAHPEHIYSHPHVAGAHQVQPPSSQEMFELESSTQQVPPAPPQYQNFEHVSVSQSNHQQGEQLMAPPGSAVIVSNAPPFPQYTMAISSAPPPLPSVSFALHTSTPPFPHPSQPLSQQQQLQRLPEPHHLSGQPAPAVSYGLPLPPSSSHPFQPHFAGMQQTHQLMQPAPQAAQTPAPPAPPVVSQYQPHPQGLSYWV